MAQSPAAVNRLHPGGNRQLNIKATAETVNAFHRMADDHKSTLGALLELVLDALDKTGNSS
jgi:hypothetical protein